MIDITMKRPPSTPLTPSVYFTTSVAASYGNKVLHSPHCSLPRVYFFTQVECLHFLPVANKLAAPKLDAIAAVQAATIFFS